MTIPDWYEAILLALAAWRVYHLLAFDDITNRLRGWLTGLPPNWSESGVKTSGYREGLAEWINCPYCFGFWIALAWWGAFQLHGFGTVVAAVPFALSAGVIAAHTLLSSE